MLSSRGRSSGRGRSAGRGRSRGGGRGSGGRRAAAPAAESENEQAGALPSSQCNHVSNQLQPTYMERNLKLIDGKRHENRPSAISKKLGHRYSTDVLKADAFDDATGNWLSPWMMPNEADVEDLGWLPEPLLRDRPVFKGPKPGPTNPALGQDSSESEIMDDLLTPTFKERCQELTIEHVEHFRRSHPNRGRKGIERAFGKDERFLSTDDTGRERFKALFDAWLAAKLRVAQLKPEVPAKALWGQLPEARNLYDQELDSIMTLKQYQWCNRHMSFAAAFDDAGDDSEDEESDDGAHVRDESSDSSAEHDDENTPPGNGEAPLGNSAAERKHDTFRKRRELTDLANRDFGKAFNPYQHVGLDEATRSTKHWERMRVKFKASVHSGTLVDMLCDCKTRYCLWFEEQHWHSKASEGSDVNSMTNRLHRAAQCLVEKQKDQHGRSTAAYCMSLDRGYGHVQAQKELWEIDGVYSNSMIQGNRIGLPREFISQAAADLGTCEDKTKCTHMPDAVGCRRFMWTALHKPPFELCLWQRGQEAHRVVWKFLLGCPCRPAIAWREVEKGVARCLVSREHLAL